MRPLLSSPLPTTNADEPAQAPDYNVIGFVDEEVVAAMVRMPLHIPSSERPPEYAVIADELDFAGWRAPDTSAPAILPISSEPTDIPPAPPEPDIFTAKTAAPSLETRLESSAGSQTADPLEKQGVPESLLPAETSAPWFLAEPPPAKSTETRHPQPDPIAKPEVEVIRRAAPPEMEDDSEIYFDDGHSKSDGGWWWIAGILGFVLIVIALVAMFQYANRSGLFFSPNPVPAPELPEQSPAIPPAR